MLGDGCLHEAWPGTSKNYVFSKMHSVKQREYLEWIHQKLQPFTRNPLRLYESTQSLRLRTIGHSTFTELRAKFYRDGKKVLPSDIRDVLQDSLALAVWFMDDGNVRRRKGVIGGYNLNTQSFTEEENTLVAKEFMDLYGIHACVEKNNGYHRIGIYAEESRNIFRSLFDWHVVPSMQYKLGSICDSLRTCRD